MSSFKKYQIYGAYHWSALSRNILKHDLFTNARYRLVIDMAQISSGMKIVDMGCGDGALTYMIASKCSKVSVTGVEPESVGRNLANKMLSNSAPNVRLIPSSSEIPSGSQSLVICADVIEHVDDDVAFLYEVARILEIGGHAIISTPVRVGKSPIDKEHVREYFPEDFNSLVSQQFQVTDHLYATSSTILDIYNWAPNITFGRPLLGWCMNAANVLLNKNIIYGLSSVAHRQVTQAVRARKLR